MTARSTLVRSGFNPLAGIIWVETNLSVVVTDANHLFQSPCRDYMGEDEKNQIREVFDIAFQSPCGDYIQDQRRPRCLFVWIHVSIPLWGLAMGRDQTIPKRQSDTVTSFNPLAGIRLGQT